MQPPPLAFWSVLPLTYRPMRIVLVNWARIWEGAAQGGGVNQYVQALGLELVKRGHEVTSLCGGTVHVPGVQGPILRRHHDWLGIRIYEVVNSPVLAPSLAQFERPLDELSAASLDSLIGDFFAVAKPDVVHWNNLEGFSAACLTKAKGSGARNIFSLHNYHTICPQVYLMQKHRSPCFSYDNGHACKWCVEVVPVHIERKRYEAKYAAEHPVAPVATTEQALDERTRAWGDFKDAVRWVPRSARAAAKLVKLTIGETGHAGMPASASGAHGAQSVASVAAVDLPGRAVQMDVRENAPYPVPGAVEELTSATGKIVRPEADQRGMTAHLLAELNPPSAKATDAAAFQPLTNQILPEPVSMKTPNEYAKRREGMVGMLNSCDRVLAVSSFVHDKFVSMGVDPQVIRTQAIGSRINRVVALKPEMAFAPEPFLRAPLPPGVHNRPVRLHFMGFNNFYKGLGFFATALDGLEQETLGRIALSIHAFEGHTIEWMFRRMEPRLANLRYLHHYRYHDIPWMLGGQDMTVVPSVWWDNGPQTVFESLACGVPVMGAAVGGIPDFVRDGVNGLLFRANDLEDLRSVIRKVVREPWIVDEMRKNVRPPKAIEEHAAEIEQTYAGLD